MKKLLLTIAVFLTIFSVSACDICGCGVGNFYLGLLPHFKSKFFGMRYLYQHYHTQIANDPGQFSNDYYKTLEAWGGINVGKKWQLLAFIPYHINKLDTDDGLEKHNGLGDISLLANYNLLHTRGRSGSGKMIEQQLWIGGGIKLPTGKNTVDLSDTSAKSGDVNSQSGTGSTDFLLNASYDISVKSFGLNVSANYKINTDNKNKFEFGNRFTANTFAYYKTRAMGLGVAPNVGILYENSAGNHFDKVMVDQTGGNMLSASGGMEINFKKIALGANVQIPVSQNFAEGQTQSKLKGLVHLTFAL